MAKAKAIIVSTREAALKKRLRSHLRTLGFTKNDQGILVPPELSKDVIRAIHSAQRDDRLKASHEFISNRFSHLIKHFASGDEIVPGSISPQLQLVSSNC